MSVRYGWEEYDTDDWAVTNVPLLFPLTGAASAVFLGNSAQNYRAHRVALLLRHTFKELSPPGLPPITEPAGAGLAAPP